MANDAGYETREAVLEWVRAKLPAELRFALDPIHSKPSKLGKKTDYTDIFSRPELRDLCLTDDSLPHPLREFIANDEMWALYSPEGEEINLLRNIFSKLGFGSASSYRDALRLIRSFRDA